jgi:hypothetical protein
MMKRIISTILLFALIFVFPARAQEPVDQSAIARIKTEGFQHSQVMETMFYLTDVHGLRLRGSPNYQAAAEWAVKTLKDWGLSNAQLEPGGFTGRGWTVNRFNVEMTEPQYQRVIAYSVAWSPATKGVVTGQPVFVEINSPADFPKYRGKLRGAIVLLRPSLLDSANLLATDAGGFDLNAANYKPPVPELAAPSFVVAREHYGRIYRLLERNLPVKLEINLQVTLHAAGPGYNVIAELPGVDPKHQPRRLRINPAGRSEAGGGDRGEFRLSHGDARREAAAQAVAEGAAINCGTLLSEMIYFRPIRTEASYDLERTLYTQAR